MARDAKKSWAGIGSRQTPKVIFRIQVRVGMALTLMGWEMSSGAAHGSDEGYELGVDLAMHIMKRTDLENVKAIYIPWNGFRLRTDREPGVCLPSMTAAMELTSRYHAGWNKLPNAPKRMMARNAFQVLSKTLDDPVSRVMCYTEDGAQTASETSFKTGGTGQAIRIASDYSVPVVNIGRPEQREVILGWLDDFDQKLIEKGMPSTLEAVNSLLDQYMTFPSRKGDLVEMADLGEFDAIAHGCNCFNTMGAGIARAIAERWPEALQVDQMTNKGDKHKLGDYTSVYVDTQAGAGALQVVNGYTQYNYGNDPYSCYVNYEKVRQLFKELNQELIGKRVGIPLIGAGLANGEWYVVERLIKESAPELDITVVLFESFGH